MERGSGKFVSWCDSCGSVRILLVFGDAFFVGEINAESCDGQTLVFPIKDDIIGFEKEASGRCLFY